MTAAYVMPTRKWAGDEPKVEAPRPFGLISSRDGIVWPHVSGAARLAKAARAAGWRVRETYAFVRLPSPTPTELRWLASMAVRLQRGEASAWGMWRQADYAEWKYAEGFIGFRKAGARELTKMLFEASA